MNRIVFILIFIMLNVTKLHCNGKSEITQIVEHYTNIVHHMANDLNWSKEKLLNFNNSIINNKYENIDGYNELLIKKYKNILLKFMFIYNISDKEQQIKISNNIINNIYREKNNRVRYIENAKPREIYVKSPNGYYADLNIDRKTAEKLAEIFVVMIYGNDTLSRKPWDIFEEKNSYKIVVPIREENSRGVKIQMEIRKSDAKIISFSVK